MHRRLLTDVIITAGDTVVDKRFFTYYSPHYKGFKQSDFDRTTANYDFFGYFNGRKTTKNGSSSLLTHGLKPALNRAPGGFGYAMWGALRSVTDALGAVTELRYEDRTWGEDMHFGTINQIENDIAGISIDRIDAGRPSIEIIEPEINDSYDSHKIYKGLRLASVTVRDSLTGDSLYRSFRYSEPTLTVALTEMSVFDFVSLEGVARADAIAGAAGAMSRHLTATLMSGSRVPGFAAENADIYYGKVTEFVMGSGLDTLRTDYEYKTDHCIHPRKSAGVTPSRPSNTDKRHIWYGDDTRPSVPMASGQNIEMFSYAPMLSYFREQMCQSPLLLKKTVYARHGKEWIKREE